MIERRREVVEKLHEFEQTIDPIVQLFEDPEVQEYIENRKWGPEYSHKYSHDLYRHSITITLACNPVM